MTTHDTRSQLLAEIAARPDDDTLRLAFADWLDEHGDAADRDRAEFIRVQCELGVWSGRGHPREVELLSAHPEWSRCRCPECDGSGDQGKKNGHDGLACPACGGTGDLLFRGDSYRNRPHDSGRNHRTVTFARGFADAVSCTLAEAFGTDGTPTPWAVEVVKQTPVVRFRMTDVAPYYREASSNGPYDGRLIWDWSSAHVPKVLMAEMAAAHHDKIAGDMRDAVWWLEFDTRDAAADALALAAGRLVRRHAYKERT